MRKTLLCSAAMIAITTAVGGPVSAADLQVKPIYKAAPPPPAMFTWTGFYFGGHLGYGSGKFDFDTGIDQGSVSSLVGGAQLGFNWQAANIVWGVEADVSAAKFQVGQSDPIGAKVDLLASLRGRLGLAFDRVLIYGTGGVGYVQGKADAQTFGTVIALNVNQYRGVAGGGVEWAYSNNFTFRVEALDYFGTTSFLLGGDNGKIGDIWVARIGANFKL
jgi:outer membrane immunogenic protein